MLKKSAKAVHNGVYDSCILIPRGPLQEAMRHGLGILGATFG